MTVRLWCLSRDGSYISVMPNTGNIMRLSHAVFFAILVAAPADAEDAPVKPAVVLDYKIYIGGLEALSSTVSIGEDPVHYNVAIKAVTAGAIGRMMPWSID